MKKEIDLKDYRQAWKNEEHFSSAKFSKDDLRIFLRQTSKDLQTQIRRSIVFDVFLKIVLGSSFLALIFLLDQPAVILINAALLLLTLIAAVYQVGIYRKLNAKSRKELDMLNYLKSIIRFFRNEFKYTPYVIALSGSFIFLSGSMFYLFVKYDEIPSLNSDDFAVLFFGLLLSYGLGAFAQFRQYTFQITHLESSLNEIEEKAFDENSLRKYKKNSIRLIIILSILLIFGLVLFMLLL